MTEFVIDKNSQGQRLDRYLKKLLPNIPNHLIQKSIRKKNITVNSKKASPDKKLQSNDKIQIFFSDETIKKFRSQKSSRDVPPELMDLIQRPAYEDDNFIVLNKPVGLLSQPDKSSNFSVSDLINARKISYETFNPAPLNRLDRNTSGILIIPKNYPIQKQASTLIRNHQTVKKYYTLVDGKITREGILKNFYNKDNENNLVELDGDKEVELKYRPLAFNDKLTLLEIDLITGKSHQIRAQLQGAGHPIIGDPKYGNLDLNQYYKREYGLKNQLLHAGHYELKSGKHDLLNVSVPIPVDFLNIIKKELKNATWLIGKNNMIFGEAF